MTWLTYNQALIPLIQKFGAVHYPKDVIQKGYFYWKSKDQSELLNEINLAISFNQPLELVPSPDLTKRPERCQHTPEAFHQTERFLERFLELNNCTDLIDCLEKERLKVRNKSGA